MIKKILKKWWWLIIWIGGTLILYFIILFTSHKIKPLPLLTADGLDLFVEVFKIPLYYFAAGIPAIGIYFAYLRMKQTDALLRENILQRVEIAKQREESEENRLHLIFTEQLKLLNKFIENIKIVGFPEYAQGKNCFLVLHTRIVDTVKKIDWDNIENPTEMFTNLYKQFKRKNKPAGLALDNYMIQIKNLLQFLSINEELKEREDLLQLLISQLSKYEIVLIFYEGIVDRSLKQDLIEFEFTKYVDKDLMFKSGKFSSFDEYAQSDISEE
jgi:hypothetical protein